MADECSRLSQVGDIQHHHLTIQVELLELIPKRIVGKGTVRDRQWQIAM